MTAPKIEQRHREEADGFLILSGIRPDEWGVLRPVLAAKFAEIEHNARQAERQSIRMENDAVRGAGPLNDLLVARRNARQEERHAMANAMLGLIESQRRDATRRAEAAEARAARLEKMFREACTLLENFQFETDGDGEDYNNGEVVAFLDRARAALEEVTGGSDNAVVVGCISKLREIAREERELKAAEERVASLRKRLGA